MRNPTVEKVKNIQHSSIPVSEEDDSIGSSSVDDLLQRVLDVVLSGFAILVLAPLLIPIIVILKLTGEHYVFYCQQRVGYRGKDFGLMKFATMLKDSPKMGTGDITTRNDPRVFPFGRFLRKSKLNELPQLFNIFVGQMSIIGPRPLTRKNFQYYSGDVQKKIGSLPPGLSGIGSVIFRDEESIMAEKKRSGMSYEECYRELVAPYKGELECWYSEHRSILCNWLIILLTIWCIVFPKSNLPYRVFPTLPPKPEWMNN